MIISALMIRRFARTALGLSLALMIAATSLSMAVARGQTRVAGEIVICTGMGVTVVSVDAEGNPTGPAHICPDMVLAMMAAPPIAAFELEAPGSVSRAHLAEHAPLSRNAERPIAQARAPPVLV